MLKEDLLRMYSTLEGSPAMRIIICYRNPGTHAIVIFRFAQWVRRQNVLLQVMLKPFAAYLQHRVRSKWGIEIQNGAKIGGGFVIVHYGGIFVAAGTVAGRNLSIAHDVTIGNDGTGERKGCPVLGDNVAINPGAKVHGKIRIGNNVHIGPNAVVNRSVPDNALVHARPMQVVVFPSLYGKEGAAPSDPSAIRHPPQK